MTTNHTIRQGMFDGCSTAEEACCKADHLADEVFLKQDAYTEAEEINKISIELIKTLNEFDQSTKRSS